MNDSIYNGNYPAHDVRLPAHLQSLVPGFPVATQSDLLQLLALVNADLDSIPEPESKQRKKR